MNETTETTRGRRPTSSTRRCAERSILFLTVGLGSGLLCLCRTPSPAAAAPPAATAPDAAQAQRAFAAGVENARRERWDDARTDFEAAYRLSPRAVVLMNLASAQTRTGRLIAAAESYRRILADTSPETATFRSAAAQVLPEIEARTPRVQLRIANLTADDVVLIDGAAVSPAAMLSLGGERAMDPGPHTLAVRRADSERARLAFSLVEGDIRQVSVTLAPPPALAPPLLVDGAGATRDRDAGADADRSRPWWRSSWLWSAVGLVVAGAAVTGAILWKQDEPTLNGNLGRIPIQ